VTSRLAPNRSNRPDGSDAGQRRFGLSSGPSWVRPRHLVLCDERVFFVVGDESLYFSCLWRAHDELNVQLLQRQREMDTVGTTAYWLSNGRSLGRHLRVPLRPQNHFYGEEVRSIREQPQSVVEVHRKTDILPRLKPWGSPTGG